MAKRRRQPEWVKRLKRLRKKWTKMTAPWYQRIGKWTIYMLVAVGIGAFLWQRFSEPQRENGMGEHTISREAFIQRLAPTAQQLKSQYGVLPSIALAQAILESDFGQSELAAKYYNLFGVKASSDDPNGVNLETKEFVNDEWITITDRFKVYTSWEDSLKQHAELILRGTSWNAQQYQAVLNGRTYQEQANGLQASGYATDPDYATKLIQVIEEWQLAQYDK